ncbi:MAG: alpha/beta hydrolase [Bauldia litoralis]
MTEEIVTFRSADGTPIGCARTGEGPPLIAVHGTSGTRGRWPPILPFMEPHLSVYAMDRRGRGASGDAEPYVFAREFEDVAAVVDGIAGETGGPVNLFGHSYGAVCSLEAALRTDNLRRLVIYEPPLPVDKPVIPPEPLAEVAAATATGDRETIVTTFVTKIVRVPPGELAMLRGMPSWAERIEAAHTIHRELNALDHDYDLDLDRFRAITVPTLLLLGSESPPFLKNATHALAGVLPNARLHVIKGQAHNAPDGVPEEFARLLVDFVTGPEA